MSDAPRLLHLATTDMSLDWLLGPQLSAFSSAGYEVVTASAPGPHVASLDARGVAHVPVRSFTRAVNPRADAAAVTELLSLIDLIRPDLIHTHNPKPGVLGRMLGRWRRVPVVNTVHGLWTQPGDAWRKRVPVLGIEALAAHCSDLELVQNVEDLDTLRSLGVPASKLVHLGNGIDLDRFDADRVGAEPRRSLRAELGIADDTVVVAMTGRMVAEKGWLEFFEAARSCRRVFGASVAFIAVGEVDRIKTDGIAASVVADHRDVVHFLGRRSDPERVLAAIDVFALPSWREGMPRSAMEASAMGLPVVATDVRGCRQVVLHERTGLLVAPRHPDQLAAAIAALVENPDHRRRLGEAGRRHARANFDQERVIARTLAAYRRVLGGSPPPRRAPAASRSYIASIDLVDTAASKRADADFAA